MRKILSLLAAFATIAPAAASAADLRFTLTAPGAGRYGASWRMPSTPVPDQVVPGQGFAVFRVAGVFDGAIDGAAYLDFFSSDNGGGLSISDADGPALFVALTGAQLYIGTEAMPRLSTGVFSLTDADGVSGYALRVAEAGAAVPEPATWALMTLGFGAAGGAMRARRRRAAVALR